MKKTEFLYGRHAGTKVEYLISKIQESLASGHEVVVIVPQNQSLYWEKLATARIDQRYTNSLEIVSFKRLADSVFRKYGGIAKNYINDSEKALLMWNTIISVSDKLKIYGKKHREDRYVDTFLSAISEMKQYGVTPALLDGAAEKMENDRNLKDKLCDLSLIFSTYSSLLSERYFDPEDVIDALCEKLLEHNYFENKDVFIDAFHAMYPRELRVTGLILSNAENVYVSIAQDDKNPDDFTAGDAFIGNYVKSLSSIAYSAGREITKKHFDDPRNEVMKKLNTGLFNYDEEAYGRDTDRITVIKCNDRYDEAILALTRIKQLVIEGARYSDIAVVCSSLPNIYGIFDSEADKLGIPVYTAEKHMLSKQGAFKFIISACNICHYGWKKENIIAIAKSGYCSLTEEESNAFEKYVNIWNINKKSMFLMDEWDMNPSGYTDRTSDWDKRCLKSANSAKAKIIPELTKFTEEFRGSVKNKCTAVFNLLCSFDIYEKLNAEAKEAKHEGHLAAAKEILQIWPAICSALDTVCKISGSQSSDAKSFMSLLSKCADKITVGSIPDGLEKIIVGDVSNMRLDSYDHVILLGASAGEFPKVPTDSGFFTNDDKIKLEEFGIVLEDKIADQTEESIFRFKYAASSPEETLTVMVPTIGKKNQTSIGTEEILRLFANHVKVLDFCGTEGIKTISSQNVIEEEDLFPLNSCNDKVSDESLAESIYSDDFKASQSMFESFLSCPYKYFNESVLHLSDDQTAIVRENILGTFVHSILENFMRCANEEKRFPLSRKEVDEMCDKYAAEFIKNNCPLEMPARSKRYFDKITKNTKAFAQSLNLEFAQSEFEPLDYEVKIGFDDGPAPAMDIPLEDGKVLHTRGVIDRIDVCRKDDTVYVRVVDYKTGSKTFKWEEALEGHHFQMLYYLFSLTSLPYCSYRKKLAPNDENISEAGVIYFETNEMPKEYSKDNGYDAVVKSISRTGVVLDNEDIMTAMDKNREGEYAPNKKGSIKTEDDFINGKEKLTETLSEIGQRMISGEAFACPEKDACKYCNFKPSCRYIKTVDEESEGGDSDE